MRVFLLVVLFSFNCFATDNDDHAVNSAALQALAEIEYDTSCLHQEKIAIVGGLSRLLSVLEGVIYYGARIFYNAQKATRISKKYSLEVLTKWCKKNSKACREVVDGFDDAREILEIAWEIYEEYYYHIFPNAPRD